MAIFKGTTTGSSFPNVPGPCTIQFYAGNGSPAVDSITVHAGAGENSKDIIASIATGGGIGVTKADGSAIFIPWPCAAVIVTPT